MKKLVLLLCACALFFVPHKAHAQSIEACKQNACFGFGPPTGPANTNGYVYQDLSQTPPALYCPKNGVWVACGGSFTGALPNGSTATTQANGDNSTLVATDAFVLANGGVQTCPLTNATNICMTAAPYLASTAGATTTTLSGTFGVGTSGPVTSCSTFNVGNGVLITGAGAAGVNYIGKVVSCTGGTLTVNPATSTSKNAGTVVQHDETGAIQAAIVALASTGGTMWFPDGTYLANGPLQDTGGANAVITMPVIANYATNMVNIGFRGYTLPVPSTPTRGAILQTAITAGNFIAGYDSATGGGKAPFTNVWLDMEDIQIFDSTANPGAVMVNATNIINLTAKNMIISAAGSSLPTNAAGWALKYPGSANNVRINVDNIAVGGFYNGFQLGEHSHTGAIYAGNTANCFVFDPGTNAGDGPTYDNNSISVDYLWGLGCTNAISSGSNLATLNVQVADLEATTGNGINDAGNLLHGILNFSAPLPANHCTTPTVGATNLLVVALQCSVVTNPFLENWKGLEGTGTTFANTGSDSSNSMTLTNVTWSTSVTGFSGAAVPIFNNTTSVAVAASAAQTAFDGTTPFSACAWFNMTTLTYASGSLADVFSSLSSATGNPGFRMGVFGTGATPVGGIDIYLISNVATTNYIHVESLPGAGNVVSASAINLVCMTYDGSKTAAGVAAYINGTAVSLNVITNALTGSMATTSPVFIGSEFDGVGAFPGALGRARIYSRKLSSTEVSAMFTAGPNAI